MLTCIMQNRWKLVNTFIEYLTKSTYRGINRDQWNNVFEFVRTFGDFENVQDYDPDGAWPVMIVSGVRTFWHILLEHRVGTMIVILS